jgi:plasmid stability protein
MGTTVCSLGIGWTDGGLYSGDLIGNNKSITRENVMTTTVKLPDPLEKSLRQRCAQEGRSISEVMRDALTAYLAQPAVTASAFALGEGVFGRFTGKEDLAETRKTQLVDVWEEKQGRRS